MSFLFQRDSNCAFGNIDGSAIVDKFFIDGDIRDMFVSCELSGVNSVEVWARIDIVRSKSTLMTNVFLLRSSRKDGSSDTDRYV